MKVVTIDALDGLRGMYGLGLIEAAPYAEDLRVLQQQLASVAPDARTEADHSRLVATLAALEVELSSVSTAQQLTSWKGRFLSSKTEIDALVRVLRSTSLSPTASKTPWLIGGVLILVGLGAYFAFRGK